jgi:hypothetical protein
MVKELGIAVGFRFEEIVSVRGRRPRKVRNQNGGLAMRRSIALLVTFLFLVNLGFLGACTGGGGEPKKKADKSESDWSASGVVKDIEEMNKASERGKSAEQPQPGPKSPQEPKQ